MPLDPIRVYAPADHACTAVPEDNVLAVAYRAVSGERNVDYGPPEVQHAKTAALWTAYLGVPVTATDVCALNILQKCSRERCGGGTRDTRIDIAGYAANWEECANSETDSDA